MSPTTKKALKIAGVCLVLFWLFADPAGAANTVNGGLSNLKEAAQAIITFVKTLF